MPADRGLFSNRQRVVQRDGGPARKTERAQRENAAPLRAAGAPWGLTAHRAGDSGIDATDWVRNAGRLDLPRPIF